MNDVENHSSFFFSENDHRSPSLIYLSCTTFDYSPVALFRVCSHRVDDSARGPSMTFLIVSPESTISDI
jgi:hypothetical protein